jgi:hypothetical protein
VMEGLLFAWDLVGSAARETDTRPTPKRHRTDT